MKEATMTGQLLHIGGAWVDSGRTEPRFDRYTGEIIGAVAIGTADDATLAVDAAALAMEAGLPPYQRAEILNAVARHVATDREEFARMIQRETGKPITAARLEVARAVGTLEFAAEEAKRLPAEAIQLDAVAAGADTMAFTLPQPRGIVAAITPFNFPLNLVVHKLGPALAAGCAVVFKPSDKAPLTAGMVVRAFEKSGLPAGWINLITGPGEPIVGAWLDDDRVEVITFTGSSEVGWSLKARSPRKTHVLELGSNTAMYVHADADLSRAVPDAVSAGFANSGQACVSLQRLYVHADVVEDFVSRLAEAVAMVPFGNPADDATVVGPLVTDASHERVARWIEQAVAAGSRVVAGGKASAQLVAPTLLRDVPADSPLIDEEVFGPVISIVTVDSLDEAIGRVNNSSYGLNAGVYTGSLAVAMEFGRRVQAGTVLTNMPPSFRADHMPYGGVKSSGQGREGVKYAVAEMLRPKLLVFKA